MTNIKEMPNGVTLVSVNNSQEELTTLLEESFDTVTGSLKSMAEALSSEIAKNTEELEDQEQRQNKKKKVEDAKVKKDSLRDKFKNLNPFEKMDIEGTFDKVEGGLEDAILGPLNLIVKPIEEAFGIDFSKKIKESIGEKFFNKEEKKEDPLNETGTTSIPSLIKPELEVVNQNSPLSLVDKTLQKDDSLIEKSSVNFFDNTTIQSDKSYTPNESTLLSKGGITGVSAVFLSHTLREIFGKSKETKEGLGSSLKEGLGMGVGQGAAAGAMTTITKTVLPTLGVIMPALVGVAVGAYLKREDIKGGIEKIKEGEVMRGIETLLLGDRDKVTDKNAGKEIGKQGAAYGVGALGVAATAGIGTAVSAAGGIGAIGGLAGLGSLVGPALAAAFPPALIAAGIAMTAKGIQSAWVNNWDTRAEEIVAETKGILASDEASWWDKTKAIVGTIGKTFFGSLVGGIKDVGENLKERFENVKSAFGDDDSSLLDKALTSLGEFNLIDIAITSTKDFFKGFTSTIGDYLKEILPEPVVNIFTNIADLVSTIYDKTLGKLKTKAMGLVSDAWTVLQGFFGTVFDNIKETIQGAFSSVSTFIDGNIYIQKALETVDNIAGFFGDLFNTVGTFIKEKFELAKTTILESPAFKIFTDILDSIGGFFGDIFEKVSGFVEDQFKKAKLAISNVVALGEFNKEALTLNKKRGEQDKVKELIETQFGGDIKVFNEAFGASGLDAWNKGLEQLFEGKTGEFKPEALDRLLEAKSNVSVNDAIITSDGQVINTHPDDNIIATKNQPKFLNDEMSEMNEPIIMEENETQVSMLSELKKLVGIMDKKGFNNIVMGGSNEVPTDFSAIRSNR